MNKEIKMIEKINTWEHGDLLQHKKVIGVNWIYKTKLNIDDAIQKHEVRLVTKRYS